MKKVNVKIELQAWKIKVTHHELNEEFFIEQDMDSMKFWVTSSNGINSLDGDILFNTLNKAIEYCKKLISAELCS
jgi:hypothetical protein